MKKVVVLTLFGGMLLGMCGCQSKDKTHPSGCVTETLVTDAPVITEASLPTNPVVSETVVTPVVTEAIIEEEVEKVKTSDDELTVKLQNVIDEFGRLEKSMLMPAGSTKIEELYGVNIDKMKSYTVLLPMMNVNSTEFALFDYKNEEDAKEAVEKIQKTRVEDLKEQWRYYLPTQLEKVNNCKLGRVGTVVYLFISDYAGYIESYLQNQYDSSVKVIDVYTIPVLEFEGGLTKKKGNNLVIMNVIEEDKYNIMYEIPCVMDDDTYVDNYTIENWLPEELTGDEEETPYIKVLFTEPVGFEKSVDDNGLIIYKPIGAMPVVASMAPVV